MPTKNWSVIVDASDAFVIVTPEYDYYGMTATVKNVIDFLNQEWKDKPIGFVSYGGIAAGTRALQQLKQMDTTLKMLPVFESVIIPFHTQFIDEEGEVQVNDIMIQAASAMLNELARTESALRILRSSGANTF